MSTYIIAEIGQNHNGDFKIAKQLIDMATQPIFYKGERLKGCDAVKFTIRDLEHEMTAQLANKRYNSKHRYATKYGNHRAKLELSDDALYTLRAYAKSLELDFILTLCQETLVKKWHMHCDKIKVASRDIDNIPLLKALSKTNREIILSTGMTEDYSDVNIACSVLTGRQVSILHCVSSYPTNYKDIGFEKMIHYRTDLYFQIGTHGWLDSKTRKIKSIGFSDHTTGILAGPIAVILGAKIIEKHITLDRDMKGTDHAGSLGPDGFYRYIRDIRNTETMMNKSYAGLCKQVKINKTKLGRSVAYKADRVKGEMIIEQDFIMISPGGGLKWNKANKFVGKELKCNVYKNNLVKENDFYE